MRYRSKVLSAALLCIVVASGAVSAQEAALISGEVIKIDEPAGRIAIKHGPITSLSMNEDGKTDEFRPNDGLLFNALKVGDKIRFSAERTNGELTVTKVEKQ